MSKQPPPATTASTIGPCPTIIQIVGRPGTGDLAGDKVVVNPLLTNIPFMDRSPDPIEQELPDLYPSCAVTRAMAKKAMLTENQSDIDLTDSFIGQSLKNEITKSLSHNLPEHQTDSNDSTLVSGHFSSS